MRRLFLSHLQKISDVAKDTTPSKGEWKVQSLHKDKTKPITNRTPNTERRLLPGPKKKKKTKKKYEPIQTEKKKIG